MATFTNVKHTQITVANNSTKSISYDFTQISNQTAVRFDEPANLQGTLPPRQSVTCGLTVPDGNTLEIGDVSVASVNGIGIPTRFWSSSGGDQYVNLLAQNGFAVTADTQDKSAVSGNSINVTVDGRGVSDPTTNDIFMQISDQ
ncbi:hypothetical protein [Melittangium boletus]|uniref:hypothetical protein n=1 Tax=Melittangium boletus TaxID=83453 RepID=UPI003DA6AB2D